MPYGPVLRPSLALGLLKARLESDGISTVVSYANLKFAEEIGIETYRFFHEQTVTEDLLGEWTFSAAAFPGFEPDAETYFSKLKFSYPQPLVASVRARAPEFVRVMAEEIVGAGPRIVGCSSTFQQHCASLALLREIHRLDPTIITMMGGANCEGPMGGVIARRFPWVDYVVSGEADEIIGVLCRDLLTDGRYRDATRIPAGVFASAAHELTSAGTGDGNASRATVTNLDAIPVPDFYDYFTALEASPLERNIRPAGLPIETSRGCWWGAKHHCTFCGLNGSGMAFRAKSADRVLQEIDTLVSRHGLDGLEVVDNILDMKYFESVLPRLAEQEPPLRVFYETKSNLRQQHIRDLSRAGVRWIQPGIESMHDDALRLLDKGNNTWTNVQLLRWAREEGVHVTWQMLAGIPGERDEWYFEIAEWLPLIYHLQAPGSGLDGVVPIRFDRFSPYHQTPERFGLSLKAHRTYESVYPLDAADHDEIAYFFEDSAFDAGPYSTLDPAQRPGLREMQRVLLDWQKLFYLEKEPPRFFMRDDGDTLVFEDTRPCAPSPSVTLDGLAREVYLACGDAPTPAVLSRKGVASGSVSTSVLDEIVKDLAERKLLCEVGGHLVSLAIAPPKQSLPGPIEFPGGHYMLQKTSAAPPKAPAVQEMFC